MTIEHVENTPENQTLHEMIAPYGAVSHFFPVEHKRAVVVTCAEDEDKNTRWLEYLAGLIASRHATILDDIVSDPLIVLLVRVDAHDNEPMRMGLFVRNADGWRLAQVPPTMRTATEAYAWAFTDTYLGI